MSSTVDAAIRPASQRRRPRRRSSLTDGGPSLLWAVHPILLAAYPVVFLFAENIREQVTIGPMLAPLGVAIAAAVVCLGVHVAVVRDPIRAGLLTSLAIFLVFAYGHARGILEGTLPSEAWLQIAWVAIGLVGIGVIALLPRRHAWSATLALVGVGAVLVVMNALPIAGFLARTAPAAASGPTLGGEGGNTGRRPDIYYLIFDRYAAATTVRDLYGYDNTPFMTELEQRGFYIAEDSHANYLKTSMAIASSLSMDYLDIDALAAEASAPDDFGPVLRLLGGPMEAPMALKSRGYEYNHIGTWYGPTATNSAADRVYRYGSLSEFSSVLYDSTLLPVVRGDSASGEHSEFRESYRQHALYEFDRLARIAAQASAVPQFVFAHVSLPHPPYVFDAEGKPVTATEERARSESQNYVEQLKYTNSRILDLLDTLLDAPPGEEPVIIIQADEGPYPVVFERDQASFDWREATSDQLRQKYAVLNAYHLPGADTSELYPSITPINSFRVVFNAYFGTDLELLPDRSYAWNADDVYELIDVTDRLPDPEDPDPSDAAIEGDIEPAAPASWTAAQEQTYTVTVTNAGASAWEASGPDRVMLGVQFGPSLDAPPQDWQAAARFELPADLAPGESASIDVTVSAPSEAGGEILRHLLLRGGNETGVREDQTVTVQPDPESVDPPLAASYDAEPPTAWSPEQTASYTVTITNDGNVAWSNVGEDRVRLSAHFGTDDDRPGVEWENEARFDLPETVEPGETVHIDVTLTAPAAPGSYVLRQRLVKENVAWFDDIHRTPVEVAVPAWQSIARPIGIGGAWIAAVLGSWVTFGPWATRRRATRRPFRRADAQGR